MVISIDLRRSKDNLIRRRGDELKRSTNTPKINVHFENERISSEKWWKKRCIWLRYSHRFCHLLSYFSPPLSLSLSSFLYLPLYVQIPSCLSLSVNSIRVGGNYDRQRDAYIFKTTLKR